MEENTVHQEDYKGHHIRIVIDDCPESPREWDNLGTMLCFHRSYDLGDKLPAYNPADFSGWADIEATLRKEEAAYIILPLYLYDHSGLRMKVGSFNGLLPQGHAEFDSGQVGFIYITRSKIREEWGVTRISPKLRAKVIEILEGEVSVYDRYLMGAVYGYVISHDETCDQCGHTEDVHDDSCFGFYSKVEEILTECRQIIDNREGEHGESHGQDAAQDEAEGTGAGEAGERSAVTQ